MPTFAHISGGKVLDPQENATLDEYKARFGALVTGPWAGHTFTEVPAGTQHCAADNGNGTYTNPVKVNAPTLQPLTWAQLAAYLIGLLGGGATGRAALGVIIKACQDSAQGADNFFALYLAGQTSFTKSEFMAVLNDVSTSIVSANAKTAVSNGWPGA